MSDTYISVVFFVNNPTKLSATRKKLQKWMTQQGYIQSKPSDCTYDDKKHSYAPGKNFSNICTDRLCHSTLLELQINGVNFFEGRQVQYSVDPAIAHCPSCGFSKEAPQEFYTAVGQWSEGDDNASVACPKCDVIRPITLWDLEDPVGFGDLTIKFYNWPHLSPLFLQRLSKLADLPYTYVVTHI
jgi:hypothetical protein